MKFNIDKGIPMPSIKTGGFAKDAREALVAMKVGDSFIVASYSQQQGALRVAQRLGVTVATRKLNGSGYRVWLVGKVRK